MALFKKRNGKGFVATTIAPPVVNQHQLGSVLSSTAGLLELIAVAEMMLEGIGKKTKQLRLAK